MRCRAAWSRRPCRRRPGAAAHFPERSARIRRPAWSPMLESGIRTIRLSSMKAPAIRPPAGGGGGLLWGSRYAGAPLSSRNRTSCRSGEGAQLLELAPVGGEGPRSHHRPGDRRGRNSRPPETSARANPRPLPVKPSTDAWASASLSTSGRRRLAGDPPDPHRARLPGCTRPGSRRPARRPGPGADDRGGHRPGGHRPRPAAIAGSGDGLDQAHAVLVGADRQQPAGREDQPVHGGPPWSRRPCIIAMPARLEVVDDDDQAVVVADGQQAAVDGDRHRRGLQAGERPHGIPGTGRVEDPDLAVVAPRLATKPVSWPPGPTRPPQATS